MQSHSIPFENFGNTVFVCLARAHQNVRLFDQRRYPKLNCFTHIWIFMFCTLAECRRTNRRQCKDGKKKSNSTLVVMMHSMVAMSLLNAKKFLLLLLLLHFTAFGRIECDAVLIFSGSVLMIFCAACCYNQNGLFYAVRLHLMKTTTSCANDTRRQLSTATRKHHKRATTTKMAYQLRI